jgi:hypothetical protein
MSSDEWSPGQYRMLLVFGLLFGGLFVYSFFDLVFLLLAREGSATVTESYVMRGRRSQSVVMEYKFKEPDGHERTGKTNLGNIGVQPPAGTEIKIQYLPRWLLDAPDASRPTRPFNWTVFTLFMLATIGFGVFAYRAIYPASELPRIKRPSRR